MDIDYSKMSDEEIDKTDAPDISYSELNSTSEDTTNTAQQVNQEDIEETEEQSIEQNIEDTTSQEESPEPSEGDEEVTQSSEEYFDEAYEGIQSNEPVTQDIQESTANTEDINYESLYKQITAPFTVSGRTVQVNNPQEAIKLMQMGANYTKQMQEFSAGRKTVEFLNRNNISENDLCFLIDLKNHNPKAIKKLLADANITDLYELNSDEEDETPYTPTVKNSVTDEDLAYKSALVDLNETHAGRELFNDIQSRWDNVSLDFSYRHPEILSYMVQHKQAGVFDQVVNEIERKKILGLIDRNSPFATTYFDVAKEMYEQKLKQHQQPVATTQSIQNSNINNNVNNSDRAKRTGVVKSSPSLGSKQSFTRDDLINLSDEEFEQKYSKMFINY